MRKNTTRIVIRSTIYLMCAVCSNGQARRCCVPVALEARRVAIEARLELVRRDGHRVLARPQVIEHAGERCAEHANADAAADADFTLHSPYIHQVHYP